MLHEDTFCRLCFEQNGDSYFSIFEYEIVKMLEALTSRKIILRDSKFHVVCSKCLVDIKAAYNIQKKAIAAEEKCENLLFSTVIETDYYKESDEFEEKKSDTANFDKLALLCEMCDEFFQFSEDLQQHMKKHDATEYFNEENSVDVCDVLCEKCGQVFFNKETFQTHVKEIHTGDYICEICDADFDTICDLDQHMRLKHSRFVCEICHEKFMLRYVLQVHKMQHSIEYPHICQFCGRKFKYNITLTVHRKIKHTDLM